MRAGVALWSMAVVPVLVVAAAQEKTVTWSRVLEQDATWYRTPAARGVADSVLAHQHEDGGWPKNVDMTAPPARPANRRGESTIDNGATTTQIRLLGLVSAANEDTRYRDAALRGLEYLLDAQYPNGGWPQIYPLKKDYSRHITFNDDAMVRVMALLDDVAERREPWTFSDRALQDRAAAAVAEGIDVMLRSQIRVAGTLTAWCAQHDEVSLEPRSARVYEHPSLSGSESVGVIRFLMTRSQSDVRIVNAVTSAVTWLRSATLHGWRVERRADPSKANGWDRIMVRDPGAPALWARFYEIGTNRPIFSGRDGIVRYKLEDIEHERRTGYAWIGDWPRALLDREYPAWKARLR